MENASNFRLKVLHLISGDLWAGAEAMAFNLLRRLKDHGDIDLSVILFNEAKLAEKLRSDGFAVCVIDENLNSFPEIVRKIRDIVVGNPPDIIHSHRNREHIFAMLTSLFNGGIKLVATQHGLPECHMNNPGFIRRLKLRANFFVLSRFFITVAVSEDIRRILVGSFGFSHEKVEVIHNGIELPAPPTQAEKTGPFVIGSSGRLFPVKDYPLMVEIARVLAGNHMGGIRFELAGDGPEHPALESLVWSCGLDDSFILRGHQDNMDAFYQGLDIYLNTSVYEGVPMTILEALARGLPVVAPSVGGIVEIIEDGIEGFLIDSRAPGDFAEKCLFLKNNPEERKRMARAAREKAVRAFSAEAMADGYYRLYRREAPPRHQ